MRLTVAALNAGLDADAGDALNAGLGDAAAGDAALNAGRVALAGLGAALNAGRDAVAGLAALNAGLAAPAPALKAGRDAAGGGGGGAAAAGAAAGLSSGHAPSGADPVFCCPAAAGRP